tara:strand:- start:2421 stop:3380 length:960 start_codon:yes stop_codon:yes gene_type:complete
MEKVKLLLNVGTCFSATSPFHFTVSYDNKCVYTGHVKESVYLLNLMFEKPVDRYISDNCVPDKRPKPDIAKKGRKPDVLTHRSKYIVGKWTKEEESQFFSEKVSIENYIAYYLKHWENCKHDYAYVGDFSNHNALLSLTFMESIKDKLLEHFDVKITMQFRDPVRRLFSIANAQTNPSGIVNSGQYPNMTPIQVMYKWLSGRFESQAYYSSLYRKYCQVWGVENVRAIVMEELWNPDTQKQELEYLSDFLEYKFTKVHENVYYPDMGNNPPKYDYLIDQWSSDWTNITSDQYNICAKLMKPIYVEFKKTFGYIPEAWMK